MGNDKLASTKKHKYETDYTEKSLKLSLTDKIKSNLKNTK